MGIGIFEKKHNINKEILILFKILFSSVITILNPISWIAYLSIYIIGKRAGESKNEIYFVAQWVSFLVAIISLIIVFIYFIYRII
ncbi:hypothetical protein [Aliarcobacter cryaerophilus]|uniref:hypothetical protein n=1 Tax=Aliarcobacter cryaerophilus TaxID=28198 RepID=UPI000827193A|nr:hypothetical protein [Aliarcobacter cryaerophilus]